MERKSAEACLESIKQKEYKTAKELREMRGLVDESHLSANAKEAEVNYVLGQSEGFVDGFQSAITFIIESLASTYRDIPMTEHELYMLVELGDAIRMAKLKDAKSKRIAEKAGWSKKWNGTFGTWGKANDE